MIDSGRYPRLAEYVASLPQGLASFPDCRAKGSIIRHLLEKHPLSRDAGLPPELMAVIEKPVSSSAWVPECVCMALHLAIGDAYKMSPAEYTRWLYEHNAGLLEGRFMFKAVMSVTSPAVLMQGAGIRFNSFRQGTHFAILGRTGNVIDYQISFPPGLYNELCLDAFTAAFQAALDMTKAQNLRLKRTAVEPGVARFAVSWGAWT